MNTRCLSLILLLLCCAVPLASAGGMAKIYLSPAEASWKTGQTVQVKVMYDNNLNPVAKDISLYFDWNAEMLKYESTEFKVGHTTVAGLLSSHELNMLLGEFTNGYPKGDYPLAVITFKVIGPGDTPLLIKVARLNDMDGKPASFVAGKGAYSITGDAVANPGTVTARPTTQPVAGQPTVIVVTPATTYTLIPGAARTTLPPVVPVQTVPAGGAPGWPVMTFGATIPTPYPTTIETTPPTAIPTQVVTTLPTTIPVTFPTTTARTTFPTPTAEPVTVETTVATSATTASQIASQTGNLGVSGGIPIYDTPTPLETPTVERTLPSPLANGSSLTAEPTEAWPLDQTVTTLPTPYVRSTLMSSAINNTSVAVAAPGGSGFGDAWMVVLAAIAGVAIVALGVVTIRRNRDDDL